MSVDDDDGRVKTMSGECAGSLAGSRMAVVQVKPMFEGEIKIKQSLESLWETTSAAITALALIHFDLWPLNPPSLTFSLSIHLLCASPGFPLFFPGFFFALMGGCTFSSGSVKAVWLSRVTGHFAGERRHLRASLERPHLF